MPTRFFFRFLFQSRRSPSPPHSILHPTSAGRCCAAFVRLPGFGRPLDPSQVRREREFRQAEARRKIEQNAARIQALEDMKAAIAEERRQVKWAEKIELDEWRHGKLFERDVTPVCAARRNPSPPYRARGCC